MTHPLRIGIAGLGVVGCGALNILREHAQQIAARSGRAIEIIAASARDITKPRDADLSGIRLEADAHALADAPDVDVVVELMGGHEGTARTLVETALHNGKHVVTANKALIAHHGQALAELAEKNKRTLAFEAAVAGGIPIIAGLRAGLAANHITRVMGILNGTCNYILTRMEDDALDRDVVMAEAAKLGYLEADPSLDIDGIDAAHKLAILASLAFGTRIDFASVAHEGIRQVTLRDMHYADEFDYRIKLLGLAEYKQGVLMQSVSPCLVPKTSSLAWVHGAFNAVQVTGDAVGTMLFQGRGAGAGPTGSAVVSDLMAIARGDSYPPFTVPSGALVKAKPCDGGSWRGGFYLRLNIDDKPGALADVTRVLGDAGISLRTVTQYELAQNGAAHVVITTHATTAAAMTHATARIAKLPCSAHAPIAMRVVDAF